MTPSGRVAFLTNVRQESPQPFQSSRGELVTRWLESSMDAASFEVALGNEKDQYGGFNLVVGDMPQNTWTWMTNRPAAPSVPWHSQSLLSGIYGLSNAALDTPWPKTVALKKALTAALNQEASPDSGSDSWTNPLWSALGNRERTPSADSSQKGILQAFDHALSSAFVDFPERGYGTVSSTVLAAGMPVEASSACALRISVREITHAHCPGDGTLFESCLSFDLS